MKILFVCKGNVGRSQMAPAFFNLLSKKHKSIGAGTHVAEKEGQPLHEFVIKCMAELGYDLSKNARKQLTLEMVKEADKIIVFDSKKQDWPDFLKNSKKVIIWEIEDPRGGDLDVHRKARDKIKEKVQEFVNKK